MNDRLIRESDALEAVDKRIKELSIDPEFVRKNGIIDVMGVKKYIITIPSAEASAWISVEERLPEPNTKVLVCGKSGGVYTALYSDGTEGRIHGWWKMNSKIHYCKPIAWMPLPEPYEPKGESDE